MPTAPPSVPNRFSIPIRRQRGCKQRNDGRWNHKRSSCGPSRPIYPALFYRLFVFKGVLFPLLPCVGKQAKQTGH